MTPQGERLLRTLARRRGDVGQIATTILELEGLPVGDVEPSPTASPGAIRTARWREKRRHGDASRDGVTEEGVGGGVSSDPKEIQDPEPSNPSLSSGVQGVVTPVGDARHVTADVTSLREPRQTDDGASGMSVDAWLAGVQLGTGKPQTRPLPRVCGALVGAFLTHCPKGEDIVAWAQGKGEAWARTLRAGQGVNAFNFIGWLGAPDGAAATSSTSTETEAQRNARIDRETEQRAEAHWRAQEADKAQDGRARAALARGSSTPTRVGGASNG